MRDTYNRVRPHSALGYVTPEEFAKADLRRIEEPGGSLVITRPPNLGENLVEVPQLHPKPAEEGSER